MKSVGLSFLLLLVLIFSCRKDSFITSPDARLSISVDTLKYDTVFTTVGSITQSFRIINENNQQLKLSSIKLMGGSSSYFKLNINGAAATTANDIEIAANDSIYVFVNVSIDPSADNIPFVIRDSISITYNGNEKFVQLEAWGQNAHFLRNKEIVADEVWSNDLPYVIMGYLYVAENTTLALNKGVRIHSHADAPIIIDGTLIATGEKETTDRVCFTGDRLDDPYALYPASWPGIYFRASSKANELRYTVIKNAYQAIVAEAPATDANPKVKLEQCIIDNSYDAGILAIGSSIDAVNTLISNCGKNIQLLRGGTYNFTHCTVVAYSNNYINHKDPVLTINDSEASMGTTALFRNCIFWGEGGTKEDEIAIQKNTAHIFTVNFDQVLWKVTATPPHVTVSPNPINNQPPLFDSIDAFRQQYNFRLRDNSPAINAGVASAIIIDLDGNPRSVGLPDLGCYERQ